ncbi:MAG: CPBP family intramembrane metalloprotease [Bacteroidetes bacterium]|nr:MAG: CPBP family intramembrane metalloprotease [Bacteroidota bacterium]
MLGFLVYALGQLILIPLLLWVGGLAFGLGWSQVQALLGGDLGLHPSGHALFRFLQAGHQILSWGLAAWLIASLLGPPLAVLHLDRAPRPSWVLLASLIMLGCIPAVLTLALPPEDIHLPGALAELGRELQQQALRSQSLLREVFEDHSTLAILANVVVFAALPAVMEEMFFRGALQRELMRLWGGHRAIWLTGLLFSLLHLQATGLLSRLVLGVLLGYFLWYSGSLWVSILAHFAFNATNILALALNVDPELGKAWPVVLGSLAAATFLFFLFRRLIPQPLYSLSPYEK